MNVFSGRRSESTTLALRNPSFILRPHHRLAYGYEVVPPPPGTQDGGERQIKPDEADNIRHIFRAYAAGKSPRVIARELNAANVPGPGGRPWGDTTIRGQADRGTGMLNNTLYIGKLSWNRCSYVKDPRTGRRVARPNSTDQREEVGVPDLRIIEQPLWDLVRARQASLEFATENSMASQPLNDAHRTKFLLSGLLTCGVCCGGYTIIGRDRYGCATRRCKGTCDKWHHPPSATHRVASIERSEGSHAGAGPGRGIRPYLC